MFLSWGGGGGAKPKSQTSFQFGWRGGGLLPPRTSNQFGVWGGNYPSQTSN